MMKPEQLDETLSVESLGSSPSSQRGLVPGELFAERYRVEAMIGRGGMGAVYRVHDERLDEPVALKLLTLEGEEAVERFVREVRLARRVTDRHVARTHDFGEAEGVRFLTMELIAGSSLEALLHEGRPLAPERVAALGAELAAGLEAAHAAGVLHRDLKPANVMIADDGRAVITDFGIARAASSGAGAKLTQTTVGTPHYMSPEQVEGAEVNARTDIYALGVILYELATGTMPFAGDDPIAVAVARLRQPPEDPRRRAQVPDALAGLILRAMNREPEGRPATASEVRGELERLASANKRSSSSASTPPSSIVFYAPMASSRAPTVAVLPFLYRGATEHQYLGEALAEELIDVLSTTKRLKVLSLGAVSRFAAHRDPLLIGRELGASAVVDGTVQLAGDRLRLSARLVDTEGAEQLWSDRFEGDMVDVFSLQESIGRRVAEALRVELQVSSYRTSAPPEAVELYLRARRFLQAGEMMSAHDALSMLDESLALAPDFAPAIATHAMACIRAWWGIEVTGGEARGQRARESAQRAIERAPEMSETHLVEGMIAVQDGQFRVAAQAFGHALALAPTMPEAHAYLGELQLETGQVQEGRRRLRLTLELDPTRRFCHVFLARSYLLRGEMEAFEAQSRRLKEVFVTPGLPVLVSHYRFALYRQDTQAARGCLEALRRLGGEAADRTATLLAAGLGDQPTEAALAALHDAPGWLANPRFTALMQQIVTEVLSAAGEREMVIAALEEAAAGILIDIEWVERCPLLRPLHGEPRFEAVRAQVARRASDVWRPGTSTGE